MLSFCSSSPSEVCCLLSVVFPSQGKMPRHNNVVPNGHFKKKWQKMVKTWFNQPGRKLRRRQGELSGRRGAKQPQAIWSEAATRRG